MGIEGGLTRFNIYRVVMRPSNSLLSRATLNKNTRVIVHGVFRMGEITSTMARCEFETNKDYKKFMKILSSSERVRSLNILEKKPGSCFIVIEKNTCDFYEYTLGSQHLLIFPYLIRSGCRHFILVTSSSEKQDETRKVLEKHGRILEFNRIPVNSALNWAQRISLASELRSILTPMQRKVLEVAMSERYYEWPRKIRLEGLSSILGVSKATISEHLRKAEQKIMSLILYSNYNYT